MTKETRGERSRVAGALLAAGLAGCGGSSGSLPSSGSGSGSGFSGSTGATATSYSTASATSVSTGTSTAVSTGPSTGTGTVVSTATGTTGAVSNTSTATATNSATSIGDAGANTDAALPGWSLTWSDEFNGADGSAVDPTKWTHDVGGTGWGNQELEYYTDGTQNAVVQGGNLVITATTAGASSYTCSYPSNGPCEYTSARLKTESLFAQEYGRFEASIQIPEGQGLWPAFWALGADINTATWPTCGEIDIMENIGSQPSINHGSLHMPAAGTTNDDELTGMYTLPNSAKLGDGFHTYAVEWNSAAIKFYVDDNLYETQTPATATGRTWEFNQPFFIILNVAVGGQFPGSPDSTSMFPQTMKVDWVRVYEPADGG